MRRMFKTTARMRLFLSACKTRHVIGYIQKGRASAFIGCAVLSLILRASFPLSGGAAMERCDQQSQEGFS